MREARPITTQNPFVGLYRFATAFPGHRKHGHRKHVALQRQSSLCQRLASRHTPFRGFQKRARSTAHHDTKPLCGPLPLCHCLPRSPRTRCPAAAVLCQRLASRHTPFRGFQSAREARPITTQNPSVDLYRFATAFPGHREQARPITKQNPSVGLYRFATAFPAHRKHVALQQQSFASAWPVFILHLEGFKTCAKHGPSRHKTPLWAFTALPLPSEVTANTLPCSGSPLPAPGLSPYSI